ncbi:hypothetical protein RBJ75_07060 [Rhodopseudomonas sp. BAL398]|nr:hypothetical protein [Rhodopseudomonas sp. BAL398]WOK19269.1 hypothetical protein RBJ75_07060 [Rhodopseudomonas sp. BAL398]
MIVRQHSSYQSTYRRALLGLVLTAPLLAGCGSTADMFSSDLLSRDNAWFQRSGRLFIKNVSIETPPLTPEKPVTPEDLISANGMCPGMAPPAANGASALSDTEAGAGPSTTGIVALGHTECDVARGAGAPDSVNISANERGDRIATLTYSSGPRAGLYTFRAGRLRSIERLPEAAAPSRSTKPRHHKRAAR